MVGRYKDDSIEVWLGCQCGGKTLWCFMLCGTGHSDVEQVRGPRSHFTCIPIANRSATYERQYDGLVLKDCRLFMLLI